MKTGFSWNTPVKVPEYANAYDWASLANEALEGRYESPLYTSEEMNIIRYGLDSDLYPNVDWRDLMLKSGAPSYYANINFSGGSDNVRYFVRDSIPVKTDVTVLPVLKINTIQIRRMNVGTIVRM